MTRLEEAIAAYERLDAEVAADDERAWFSGLDDIVEAYDLTAHVLMTELVNARAMLEKQTKTAHALANKIQAVQRALAKDYTKEDA